MDGILEQLNGPVGIGVAVVAGLIVLFLIRKLLTLIFLVAAVAVGGWATARQMNLDIPFLLPGELSSVAQQVADRVGSPAAAAPAADASADAIAGPESLRAASRSLGAVATVSPEAAAADAAAADVRRAEIRYNAPARMQLNMPIDLRLAIDASGLGDPASLLEGLPGEIREGQADLTRQATATLTGSGFDIRPLKPPRQVLPDDRAVTWQWEVTPRAEGTRTLILEVFAHPGGGEAASAVREFRDEIEVEVTFLSRALGFMQTTQPALGFAAAAVSLGLAGVGMFRRKRRV